MMDNEVYNKLLSIQQLLEMAKCDYMRTITVAEANTIAECAKALGINYDCATCAGSRIATAKRLYFAFDCEYKKRLQAEETTRMEQPTETKRGRKPKK